MPTQQHVVILRERDSERYLPIWIGNDLANAIAMKIQGVAPDRPLTHDLMKASFEGLGVSLNRIVVSSLDDQVFYARLYIQHDSRELDVDSRPSDAIALAVRYECPIYVAAEVLEKAGVIPQKEDEDEAAEELEPDRLAVFRDLVNNLDLPDLPEEPGARGRGPSRS